MFKNLIRNLFRFNMIVITILMIAAGFGMYFLIKEPSFFKAMAEGGAGYKAIAAGGIVWIVLCTANLFFLNRMILPVKKICRTQEKLIQDTAHELITPLTIINTNVDLILNGKRETLESKEKLFSYIQMEIVRLSKLADDLLYRTNIGPMETGKNFSRFNLSEVLDQIVLSMEAIALKKNVVLEYAIEPKIYVRADLDKIKQLIIILLDNAIKYVNYDGKINISLVNADKQTVLVIENTGDGMDEDEIEKIFSRFYRAGKSMEAENAGYGLGLPIAKEIVTRHRGSIKAASVINELTTFSVMLPIVVS